MPISGSTPMQTEFLQFDASQRNQFAQKNPSSHVPQQTVTYSNKKPLVSPCVSDSLTQAQIDIREKLAAMKRLFDDEDNNAKDNLHSRTKGGLSRPESSDWDLHNHKLLYEETLEKRKRHMELVEKRFQTQGLEGEHPTPKNQKKQQEQAANKVSHNYEMQEEELRDFLLHRIADLKLNDAKTDTDKLKMFKFKASTISNLLPSGSDKQEQRRLAENYKRRFKKGDQIHQKQQIVQQRRIEHINNAQRIDLQHSMELLKKDLVSQRSKSKSRGPSSGSEDGSGSNSLPIKLKEGDQTAFSQSFNGGSSQGRGKARKPQDIKINTNLDEQEDLAVRSDGYSTQRNSIMIEHNHQKTRVSPMGGLQTETSPLIRVGMSADRLMSQEPDQRKPELIQIQQQVLVYSEPEQAKNDEDAYSEESAIIFYIASGNSIDSNGKRQNKYTQVMRQLDAIDKKFAKKSKMNKRGMKKETRKIIEKAKQDQMREEMHMFVKKEGTLDMTEQNQPDILESESDDDRIQNVHELINRSLQEEINGGAEKAAKADVASQKKGSVIVVQVSQHGTSRNEYGSEQTQNEKPHTAVVKNRLGKVIGKNLSRSQSQNSNNSRINSENYLQSEDLAESPTNPNYYKEKLDSAISQSIQRGTPITSVVVFNHGAQKYSDNNVETEKKENQDDRQLPNSFRKESTLSLNAPLGEESDHRYVDMKKLDMGVTLMEDLTNTAQSGRFTQLSINIAHSQAVPDAKQPNQPPMTTQEGFAKTNNINLDHSFVTGSQLSYFCPKRFNRFPRFTIFFKKGQKELQSVYGDDNTVSLNSDFLKFLSDKRPDQQTERSNATSILQQKERDSKLTYENTLSLKEKSQIQQTQEAKDLLKMPADVLQWNNYLKQKNFDPFDKVVLVKGIDNSILTSFRTLRGDNNTVSDTFKIVHRKFAPQTTHNSFFKTMMLKHVGKLPYQTMFNFRDLDEEEDIEDFDVFEENEDGTFKQIQVPVHQDQVQIAVNHGKDVQNNLSAEDHFSSMKLQHAMTAAFIDFDKETRSQGGKSIEKKQSSPPRGQNLGEGRILHSKESSAESFNYAVKGKQRMPRPQPLNLGMQKGNKKRQGSHSPEKVQAVQNSSFSVQGISPLTIMANNLLREQQELNEPQSPEWGAVTQVTIQSPKREHIQTQQTVNQVSSVNQGNSTPTGTQQNSIYKIDEPALETSHLIPQESQGLQNWQSKSKKISQAGNEQVIREQTTSEYLPKHDSTFKSQKGTKLSNKNKNRILEIQSKPGSSFERAGKQQSQMDTTNILKNAKNSNINVVNEPYHMPKSSLDVKDKDFGNAAKTNEQPFTPIQSKTYKQQMIVGRSFIENDNYPSTQVRRPGFDDQSVIHKDSQQTKEIRNDGEVDSQHAFISSGNADLGRNFVTSVNVIKSKAQIVTLQSSAPQNSLEAADGDVSKRTHNNGKFILDNHTHLENIEFFHNSPVIHQALGKSKILKMKHDSLIVKKGDTAASPRGQGALQGQGNATDRPSKRNPVPAEHVGVLKVPNSLKAQHLANDLENNIVEQVAQAANRKGAVSNMIDKIYTKDRQMVNNMYKGNMLNTAILTDMTRYHNLKSQTGVENKNYDQVWQQERIEEEKLDFGLSLDCIASVSEIYKRTTEGSGSVAHSSVIIPSEKKNKILKVRQSLKGILEKVGKSADSATEINYAEMVNRSET